MMNRGNIKRHLRPFPLMSDDSVNVESRTSSQDKRWTIMAALLGTNTALMLFQGIEQERTPKAVREVALTIVAAALPFQAIYFLIYTYVLEHKASLSTERLQRLELASAVCQVVAYLSLSSVALMWYDLSPFVGFAFAASTVLAVLLIRVVMMGGLDGPPPQPESSSQGLKRQG